MREVTPGRVSQFSQLSQGKRIGEGCLIVLGRSDSGKSYLLHKIAEIARCPVTCADSVSSDAYAHEMALQKVREGGGVVIDDVPACRIFDFLWADVIAVTCDAGVDAVREMVPGAVVVELK